MTLPLLDIRVRARTSDAELERKVGKLLLPRDWNVLLTGPAKVWTPDGKLLCVYLPGLLSDVDDGIRRTLTSLKSQTTNNRGAASGTLRIDRGNGKRSDAKTVASAVIGAMDPAGPKQFCRLTAWTGAHAEEFTGLGPLLRRVAAEFERYVPDRFLAQKRELRKVDPAWIIPGTPFTTVTVNNSYPTGVHTDKGDLDAGFSTIACFRRGAYTGGVLGFPRYRVAVDLRDGDLLLMNAHEHHGNQQLECPHGFTADKANRCCGAERITVVSYMRSGMVKCGTPAEETTKAAAYAERTSALAAK